MRLGFAGRAENRGAAHQPSRREARQVRLARHQRHPFLELAGLRGAEGTVEVYSDAASVAPEINGQRTKQQKSKDGKAIFKIAYQPGTLAAVNYDANGHAISRSELKTADKPVLTIAPERATAKPGEILFVPINVQDKHGIVESNADRLVSVTVTGGELLAFGSAAPRTEERYDNGTFTTYYGRSLAVIQAGNEGSVTVSALEKESGIRISNQIIIKQHR